mmetsp:Transcript_17655/g.26367  ORF Transcript_17655/g.26367 Transcript_17655/m.26367 type:complete len:321 (+) Transcript_17655:136-1098(+)
MPGRRQHIQEGRRILFSTQETNTPTSSSTTSSLKDDIRLPIWLQQWGKQFSIIQYDTTRYPFRELVAGWLEVPGDKLETIHTISSIPETRLPLHPTIRQAWTASKTEPQISSTMRRAKKKGLFSSPQYKRYIDTYRLFVKEVISPLCYGDPSISTASITDTNVVYQYPPTTRVVLPNGNKTISMHCDKDYPNHQEAEINFWLPLTHVFGNNSLFVESEPGIGDFQPVEMRYGQFLKFNGHDCRHYTVHNDTHICRVSLDFRVIPSCLCKQRSLIGDFCVEETNEDGFKTFWVNSKKSAPMPCSDDSVQHIQYDTTLHKTR